ncbi:hypothetical protein C8R43DRAFT_76735 [Mycena crocata]|nr:hypothetical protein C8R43DRAFT_76735 [Mycena crocata]
MQTIPPEIWSDVFCFACTDDGSTGRALSTVSRAVHTISKPHKYQSVCAVGRNQLLKLLEVLSVLSPSARKVRYFFVAGLDESLDRESPDINLAGNRRQLPVDTVEKVLPQILDLLSPNLLALHIHRTKIVRQSLFLKMEMPVLLELALYGPFNSTQSTILPAQVSFPSLRKVHIHHFGYHPAKFLHHIAQAAPLLAHLRVPQRSFSAYEIQVALGMLQPAAVASPEVSQLPPSLERLVIELDPVPSSLDSWASNIRSEQFFRKFQKISERDARVSLVNGRNGWISVEEAKEVWLGNLDR